MKEEIAVMKAKNFYSGQWNERRLCLGDFEVKSRLDQQIETTGHKKTWNSGAKSKVLSFDQEHKCGICHKIFGVRSGLIQHIECTGHKKGWKKSIDSQSDPDFKTKKMKQSTVTGEEMMKMIDLLRKVGFLQNAGIESMPRILTEKLTEEAPCEGEQASTADSHTPNFSTLVQSTMDEIPAASTVDMVQPDECPDSDLLKISAHFKCDTSPREASTFKSTGVALSDRKNAECFTECILLGHRGSFVGK